MRSPVRSVVSAAVLAGLLVGLLAGCSVATPIPVSGDSDPPPSTESSGASAGESPSAGPPTQTLQSAFDLVGNGVVRLEVAGCQTDSMGSGFAIGPDLVVTAAHVVDGGRLVRAITGSISRSASVVGLDRNADIALLRVIEPVLGHHFTFSPTAAKVGDAVAALGYPDASPLAFSPGTVNGVGRKAVIDGIPRFGLVEFDSATTHGGSGGPLIKNDGTVVGVVDAGKDGVQGRRLAVNAQLAAKTIAPWRSRTSPLPTQRCGTLIGPNGQPVPAQFSPGSDAAQVFGTLRLYFDSINQGDYLTALAQFVSPLPLDSFTRGVESSHDTNFVIRSVTRSGDQIIVWLTFTSTQQAGRGPAERPQEVCSDWSLDYVMKPHNGLWLISDTTGHGTTSKPCAKRPTPSGSTAPAAAG